MKSKIISIHFHHDAAVIFTACKKDKNEEMPEVYELSDQMARPAI